MSDERWMVAVDVGNSAVKFAMGHGETNVQHSIGIGVPCWERSAIQWAWEQTGGRPWHWRIASVQRSATEQLRAGISAFDPDATVQLVTRHDVPMALDIDHPDLVGIDRLLSAYAVSNRVQTPAVVVDAGSAVTVDWIDQQGCFCGGAILPGLRLQAAALATGTDALPRVDWTCPSAIRLPARNTTDAIFSGILTGIAAGIDGLIERYRVQSGMAAESIQIVVTGGDGPAISPHLKHNHRLMQNLVCRGLMDLPRSMVANADLRNQLG